MKVARPTYVNGREERRRLLGGFTDALGRVDICICCTSWWLLVFLGFQSDLIFPESYGLVGSLFGFGDGAGLAGAAPDGLPYLPANLPPNLIMGLSMFVMTLWHWKTRRLSSCGLRSLVVMAAVMTLGTVLVSTWRLSMGLVPVGVEAALFFTGAVVCGVGCSLLLVEFNRISGYLGMLKTMYYNVVALALGCVVVMILASLPVGVRLVFFMAMPAVFVASYWKCLKSVSKEKYFRASDAPLQLPARYMATSAVQGLALGVAIGLQHSSLFSVESNQLAGAAFVAMLLLISSMLLLKLDFNRLLYQIGFLCIASGFALMSAVPGLAGVGLMIQQAGFYFTYVVLGGVTAFLIKNRGVSSEWITACPGCCLHLALSVGILIGHIAFGREATLQAAMTGSGLLAFGVLAAAILLSNPTNMASGWGMVKPTEKQDESGSLLDACLYLGCENGLTPREQDILVELAQGRRRKEIALALSVSEETVKSHVSGIYRKLGVHSAVEVERMVADARATLGPADGSS